MSAKEKLPPVRGEKASERRERTARIVAALRDEYPDAHCALTYRSPFELLIATILSAQCTDARVNMVTPALFDAYPDATAMANASTDELEDLIRSTGFFRQKAKSLLATSQGLVDRFDGVVPQTMEGLTSLRGVARKTANVVISNCFPDNPQGIPVDTHVQRITRRLGMTRSWETDKIERDLMRDVPQSDWNIFTHLIIDHGRAICRAPTPLCGDCPSSIASRCPSRERFL